MNARGAADDGRPYPPRSDSPHGGAVASMLAGVVPLFVVACLAYLAIRQDELGVTVVVGELVAVGAALAAWAVGRAGYPGPAAGATALAITVGCATPAGLEIDPHVVTAAVLLSGAGPAAAAGFLKQPPAVALALVDFVVLVAAASLNPAYSTSALALSAVGLGAALGGGLLLGAVLRDSLAERDASDQQLRRTVQRLDLLSRGANDGLWEWDIVAGIARFSPRWQDLLDLRDPLAPTLEAWLGHVHSADVDRVRAELAEHVAGGSAIFRNSHRLIKPDGTVRWVEARGLALRDSQGRALLVAGSATDVTERKQYEDQLLHDAFHDVLTGLPNRPLFLNRLAHSIARSQRRGQVLFAVLFVDLDRFKVVNEAFGHAAGDDLLVQIARRLEACVRPGDTVARIGGDEFIILVDELDGPSEASEVADRILAGLRPPFHTGSSDVVTSASIGIALSSVGYFRPEDIVRDADIALHAAKASGKSCHSVFHPGMHADALEHMQLESDLRGAVERGDFVVHYQPLVSLESGRIMGFEALVRWLHPERGMIPPVRFIPIAEETGMITPLGWFVLRTASRQARRWLDLFPLYDSLTMSVNLSPIQITQPGVVDGVQAILDETGLPPTLLKLELTETVAIAPDEAVRTVLQDLRKLGVKLCIDDFGTGYAGLQYLHSFDVDALKIDRSFVSRMGGERVPKVVQTIIDLSRTFGLEVTAEGVEAPEQAALLRSLGCQVAQGFYYARPLDPDGAERLLARNPDWLSELAE